MKGRRAVQQWGVAVMTLLYMFSGLGCSEEMQDKPKRANLENEKTLADQAKAFYDSHPEDRLYLHFDKPFYGPGEIIWFTAFLRDSWNFERSQKSDIIHVELLSPKGNVDKELQLIARDGRAVGDFALPEHAAGGIYRVRAFTNWQKNESEKPLFDHELQVQAVILPRLKMTLDFKRKAYGPGSLVEADLTLQTNAKQALANKKFRIVAQLNGLEFESKSMTSDDSGKATLSVQLPDKLETTDGLLNIIIPFEGQQESISRSIPIVLNRIDLSFFPEGGDLISGLASRVAFRARNEFGKPADIRGAVYDGNGKELVSFSSFHMGMGAFDFEPDENERYHARILSPGGIEKEYPLPEIFSNGYVMRAEMEDGQIHLDIFARQKETMQILVQMRGHLLYSEELEVRNGRKKLVLSAADFPAGVARITLFDSKRIERAERLLFVNSGKKLKITIKTDKEKYQPREKVSMTIKVEDDRGMPMPAQLSLAVADDQLLSFADDKQGHILSSMLLETDLREKVEEPRFYFDPTKKKAAQALDYLLMTSGWRRFIWKEVLDPAPRGTRYSGERAIVGGVVFDWRKNKPMPSATVKFIPSGQTVVTDDKGRFSIATVDLSEKVSMQIFEGKKLRHIQAINTYNEHLEINIPSPFHVRAQEVLEGEWEEADMEAAPMIAFVRAADELGLKAVGAVRNEKKKEAGLQPKRPDARKRQRAKAGKDLLKKELRWKEEKEEEMEIADEIADKRLEQWPIPAPRREPMPVLYHRAREFAAPVYDKVQDVALRDDFRSTLYWKGDLDVDRKGVAHLEFYNSDQITSFRTTVEGIGAAGLIGRGEHVHFTQLPFSLTLKLPVELSTQDSVRIPITLKNNGAGEIDGSLDLKFPAALKPVKLPESQIRIKPGDALTVFAGFEVLSQPGDFDFSAAFQGLGMKDAVQRRIRIVPKGFPVEYSFSSNEQEQDYEIEVASFVEGSMTVRFTAFPSVVNDLMKGIESILREPSGCFEQTSMSSYPNAMVLSYMKEAGIKDAAIMERAKGLLSKGYKRLVSFETPEKGYEWFGGAPGHEALTAYGLMQFNDMRKVSDEIDRDMVDRTARWLMDRRDGKGGFKRNSRALDSYGRASESITNAYIVYALSEAGYASIVKEADLAFETARKSGDSYELGLMANAMFNLKQPKRAEELLRLLLQKQRDDGAWAGSAHSITHSTGKSLQIETTALVVMALLKAGEPDQRAFLTRGVEFIVSSRSGAGGFGSTQGTVLALKALTQYARYSQKTDEAGDIEVWINGKKAASAHYDAGQREEVVIEGLSQFLAKGKHRIKVKYIGVTHPLPYALGVDYSTFLPPNSSKAKVEFSTILAKSQLQVGETVRLTASLKNKTHDGLPMTMAIVGIPAGLSAQPWQLKELQEKNVVDFYEIIGNEAAFYYRQLKPDETRKIELDIKAEIPGEFEAPASRSYLYYTNEDKIWSNYGKVTVLR
ncbi:MAG: hypothetical protein GY862_29175 [Gammaproteobacteria bacterium]|nr:hypothetical protein [Gammaproteobacteria bacterium]